MEAVCRRRESFQPRGRRLRLSCKFDCEARRGFGKVSTINSRGSKSESSIPLNTQTKEKDRTSRNSKQCTKHTEEIPLSCSSKRESELSFRFDCNNITLKVEDDVVQRFHLIEKD